MKAKTLVTLVIINISTKAQNIIEYTKTLDYNSLNLIEDNLMFLNIENMEKYSAQDVLDNPDIGDIGFLYHSVFGDDILASPNAQLIQHIYSYNGITYYPDDKRNTKFEYIEIQWNDLNVSNFENEIIISDSLYENMGNGVDTVGYYYGEVVIKFQTQDNIIGFMQIDIFPKVTRAINLNIKLLDNNSKIGEDKATNINVYPNPTNGIINFEFANNNVQQIIISDITGKMIIEKVDIQQNEIIDLSNFESGIYIIKIQTDNEIFTTKIVKE